MSGTEPRIRSLSQRELRNEPRRVLRAVGERWSFVLTNSRVPVGRIVQRDEPAPTLRIARPARRRGGWAELGIARRTDARSLSEILDELRKGQPVTPGVIVYVDTSALGALLIEQPESNALVDRGGNQTADALVSSDLLETELRRIACLGGH